MKALCFGLVAVMAAMGQNQTGRTSGPIGQGFGSVVFPGTGVPSIGTAVQTGQSHAERLGATVSGRGVSMTPQRPAGAGSYYRQGSRMIPYPVVVPYLYGSGYSGYGYGEAPNVTVVNQAAPAPAVIINQNYAPEHANPVVREYATEDLPVTVYQAPIPSVPEGRSMKQEEKPTIYLIALKDGTVYAAYAYWVEGDTLYYVTTKHSQNKATIDLIDAGLSEQLNRERGLEFKVGRK